MARQRLKKTSGGLTAVDEIPKQAIELKVISFIASHPNGCTKLENLEDRICNYYKFKYRGKNKEALMDKIWDCVNDMLEEEKLIQYFAATMTMVKINSSRITNIHTNG